MLVSCICVVVVVVVDGVVIGFEDNIVVDIVFYRECIEGYVNQNKGDFRYRYNNN